MQQEFHLADAQAHVRPCASCGRPTGMVWAHLWSDRRRSGYTEYHVCSEACAQTAAALNAVLETGPLRRLPSLPALNVGAGA